jgi:acyl carrier protein
MEWDEFTTMLLTRLELGDEAVTPYTGLFDDLGLDSFRAFEMIVIIESAAGLDVPPPDIPEIYTVGDAFEYYRTACELAASA